SGVSVAIVRQGLDQRRLECEPDRAEIARVLGLGIDPDRAAGLEASALGELDHLLQGWDLVDAVPALVAEVEPLLGAQRLDLGEREVLGEVTFDRLAVDRLAGAPARKLLRHVGGAGNVILMPRDQHAILRGDEIGLNEIDAVVDREAVGREGVLGPMASGSAVADDVRRATAQGWGERRHRLRLCGGHEGNNGSNRGAIEDDDGHALEKMGHIVVPLAVRFRYPLSDQAGMWTLNDVR